MLPYLFMQARGNGSNWYMVNNITVVVCSNSARAILPQQYQNVVIGGFGFGCALYNMYICGCDSFWTGLNQECACACQPGHKGTARVLNFQVKARRLLKNMKYITNICNTPLSLHNNPSLYHYLTLIICTLFETLFEYSAGSFCLLIMWRLQHRSHCVHNLS